MNTTAFKNIDQQFQFLDDLPDSLYQKIVTLHYGSLKSRVAGIIQWRNSLLSGEIPDTAIIKWPEPEISKIIIKRLDGLDVVDDCRSNENLTDEILSAICDAIESIIRRRQQNIHGLFDDLLDRPFKKRLNESKINPDSADTPNVDSPAESNSSVMPDSPSTQLDHTSQTKQTEFNNQVPNLNNAIDLNAAEIDALLNADELVKLENELNHQLKLIIADWSQIKAVCESMNILPGRGWDMSQGALQKIHWQQMADLRKVVKSNPQLKKIIDSLGREKKLSLEKDDNPGYSTTKTKKPEVPVRQEKQITSDPMHTRGVTRSDDISRMLASEAVLLGHTKMKMLWHARRAEQALMTYQIEGVLSSHIPDTESSPAKKREKMKSISGEEQSGPIILCIDTSGSMKGAPEFLSKAVTLEAVRLASEEKRDCYLMLFSGTNQIQCLELAPTYSGLREIMKFLQMTYHGGTDVIDALNNAISKVRNRKWRKADILLISDGLFNVESETLSVLRQTKKRLNLRIHGLLVNGWRSADMMTICQPLHEFRLAD